GRRVADDTLYRGTVLVDAQSWAKRNVPSADEMAFIEASVKEEGARRARDEAIARRVRNFQRIMVGLAILGVLLIIIAVFAGVTATKAIKGAQAAQNDLVTLQAQSDAAQQTLAPIGATLTPIPMTFTAVAQKSDALRLAALANSVM